MLRFEFVFIALFAFPKVATEKCPENSINLRLNSSICYSFHPSLSQYVIAEWECNSFGATVISVKNKFTNVYVAQLANLFFKHLEVDELWTSGHRLINDKSYQWIDGDKIGDNHLAYIKNSDNCIAVNLEKGIFIPEDCFSRLPFVCEFVGSEVKEVPPTATILKDFLNEKESVEFRYVVNSELALPALSPPSYTPPPTTTTTTPSPATTTPTPLKCPDSWSYFSDTGFCYKVFENMDWHSAEKQCIENEAHLTSIHSQAEAYFVGVLARPITLKRDYWIDQPYIGLYTNDSNAHWHWTDGTDVAYLKWGSLEPNNPGEETCGQIWSSIIFDYDEVKQHDFNNIRCSKICNFICKKSPS